MGKRASRRKASHDLETCIRSNKNDGIYHPLNRINTGTVQ
jgi:hypothetical protein